MNDYYINLSYEDRRNTSFIETKTKKTRDKNKKNIYFCKTFTPNGLYF